MGGNSNSNIFCSKETKKEIRVLSEDTGQKEESSVSASDLAD
jgi:hypothetical protein